MPEETFDVGHVFFRPGDPGERAYLLHEGRVEVVAGPWKAPGVGGPEAGAWVALARTLLNLDEFVTRE